MKYIFTLLILLIFTTQIYGTTEYLAKNNITKELFIFEDDRIINYDGLFWKPFLLKKILTTKQKHSYYQMAINIQKIYIKWK